MAALSLIVDIRTDGRTFLPGLLGHLSGDDLKCVDNTIITYGRCNKLFTVRNVVHCRPVMLSQHQQHAFKSAFSLGYVQNVLL